MSDRAGDEQVLFGGPGPASPEPEAGGPERRRSPLASFKLWASLLFLLLLVGAGLWVWWNFDLRWRPHAVRAQQAEVARLLEQSGWVTPGGKGARLYVVTHQDCPGCVRFQRIILPRLQASGVQPRITVFAPADLNGLVRSTPVERATVAELWINRSWPLYERWMATAADDWRPSGLRPADGDAARTAVVEASRTTVRELGRSLKRSGVKEAYPLLVWWTPTGEMHACSCSASEAQDRAVAELTATFGGS